jgi:hypothetical protein
MTLGSAGVKTNSGIRAPKPAHSVENGAFSSGVSRLLWINGNHLQMLIN